MATTSKIPQNQDEANPVNPPIEFPRPPKAPERADPKAERVDPKGAPSPQAPSTKPAGGNESKQPGCSGMGTGADAPECSTPL